MVARVKAILRRYKAGLKPGEAIEAGNLRIDHARREATIDRQPLRLPKNSNLLATPDSKPWNRPHQRPIT